MTDRRQFHLRGGTRGAEFVQSNRFVDFIMGPLGSGKTHLIFAKLMRHAQEQRPSTMDGLRKTRWAVVRNTYPELKRSTIRTWNEIAPEHIYGRMNWSQPPSHRLKFPHLSGDGSLVQTEIDFLALDKPEESIPKLRSTEYTGIVFNELQYIQKPIFDEATSRLRYPSKEEGGATWRGVFGDLNAPDEDHWISIMTGLVDIPPGLTDEETDALGKWPEEWGFHVQPPALQEILDANGRVTDYKANPIAENAENLDADYYIKQIVGKTKSWIDSRLMVRVVLVLDGSAVWPMFKPETHVASGPFSANTAYDIEVGLDFGRQPAAIFGQAINQRVLILNELLGHNEGAVTFAPKVRRFIQKMYPDHQLSSFRFWGDPKGQDKGQADERTAYDIFEVNGMKVRPAPVKMNMIETRVAAVANLLNEMYDGRARFALSPACRTLKVAMAGRYHNEKDDVGDLSPCKDRYSNPADALQYLCLGMGEGRRMVGKPQVRDQHATRLYKPKTMRRIQA
jgi:hypothetical protein